MLSLKARLKVFRHDWLSHYQWASWFALAVAMAVMAILLINTPISLSNAAGIAAIAAMATSIAAGVLGEKSDAAENENGGNREVSRSDAVASSIGGLPVALPLVLVWFMSR
jgi:hypothetical protein